MRLLTASRTVTALAAALLLAGCAGGTGADTGAVTAPDQQRAGSADINPLPRDQVRDGGDLRWPIDTLPDNFNINHVDGYSVAQNSDIMAALLPSAHVVAADGTVTVDRNYFTAIELTSTDPQVVTYTVAPEASWDDGTPITWNDLRAQWQALAGTNPAYLAGSTTGYEDIASVERGVDDKQAVITFARPFAEWRVLFGLILPASVNGDPGAFEAAWREQPGATAGPFRLAAVDRTAQIITLERNDAWWGEPAKLDRIVFRVVSRGALADALANNEIDFYPIGSDVNLFARARTTQGAEIRQAVEPAYNHMTFNGAQGALLADPALRRALAQAVDRQAITDALIGQVVPDARPLGNRLYPQGSANYVDHAAPVAFDPAAAAAALDGLGWTGAPVRSRGGQPLNVRLVVTAGVQLSERISQLIQAQLTAVGVGVELVPAPPADLFEQYITPGNFDLVTFSYSGDPFPVTATRSTFTTGGGANVSGIGSPEVDALYSLAIAELDDAARVALGQQIDKRLWQLLPQVPLYQSTGAYAVRDTLANLGAPGFGEVDYAAVGFAR